MSGAPPIYVEEVRLTRLIPTLLALPMAALVPLLAYFAASGAPPQLLLPGAAAAALIALLLVYLVRGYGSLELEVAEGALRIRFGRSELLIPAADVSTVSAARVGPFSLWTGPQVWRGTLRFLVRGGPALVFHMSRPLRDVLGEIGEVWVSTSRPSDLVDALILAGFPPPSRPPEEGGYRL